MQGLTFCLMMEHTVDPAITHALIRSFRSESDVRTRLLAATLLSRSEEGLEPLIESLNDPEESTRAATARALGQSKAIRALLPLKKRLNDKSKMVVAAACEAIARLDPSDPDLKGQLSTLLAAAKGKHPLQKQSAFKALAVIGGEEAKKCICEALRGKYGHPISAILAVAPTPEAEYLPDLRRLLDSRDPSTQSIAVRLLYSDEASRERIFALTSSRNEMVAFSAAASLHSVGDPRAVAAFERCAQGKHSGVAKAARRALERPRNTEKSPST